MFKNIIEKAHVYDTLYSLAKKGMSIPSETMFEYPACPFACYYF